MNRRAPLLQVDQANIISSGLLPDRHDLLQPLWSAAANVRFYQGKVRRLFPAATMFTPSAGVSRGLHQQQTSDGVRWVWTAVGGLVYRWFASAATLIATLSNQTDQSSIFRAGAIGPSSTTVA
jgi:hypothetical protein